MFSLAGKSAVVTGAGSGIGKAVALLFAAQGARVHVLDLDIAKSSEVCEEIIANGGKASSYACNVASQEEVKQVFERIAKVDLLVNNAGIAHIGKADTTEEKDFDRVYQVNVKGVYNCLYTALPMMKEKGGAIVNMSSIAALTGLTDRFAYSMSKGAVYAMTMSVARDYISSGIRCNSISPARVHTPFVDGFLAANYPGKEAEMFDKLSKTQPIGRMGTPQEIATLILFLCSEEAGFITGCDYPIDGGFVKLNT
jgi:NAD(P)-dependent dehydrogenase (short-subunit alcohol dehydrogenase family)